MRMRVADFGLYIFMYCMTFWLKNAHANDCQFSLVESIPQNLTYPANATLYPSTYKIWMELLSNAKHTLDIASFYWTMLGKDVVSDPSDSEGEAVFKELTQRGKRGLQIRVAVNKPGKFKNPDLDVLKTIAKAKIRTLDFDRLVGQGILHTKIWLVDGQHAFIGSANMDWRSLTQVKELGVYIKSCPILVNDLQKIFEAYWYLGVQNSTIPVPWPEQFNTKINAENPTNINMSGNPYNVYIAASPQQILPTGRTRGIDAILREISSAKKFIYIAVMDYSPTVRMYNHRGHDKYWPIINDALIKAAFERGVKVRILASLWNHTSVQMKIFLQSLYKLNFVRQTSIEVKLFCVPTITEAQRHIPYSRVNHNKYMVTDQTAFIGTSNWSGDYFLYTGGVAFVVKEHFPPSHASFRGQLESVYNRDWLSNYTYSINTRRRC